MGINAELEVERYSVLKLMRDSGVNWVSGIDSEDSKGC